MTNHQDRAIALTLGLIALALYLLGSAFTFHSIDEVSLYNVSRSLAGRGSLDVDILFWTLPALERGPVVADGIDGHTYSTKDAAPAILITPLVWLSTQLGISSIRITLLFNPLITALTAAFLYYIIRCWGYSRLVATAGALLFALGSLAWPYAETFFTQPLAALGLLIALYATIRAAESNYWQSALIAGIGLGLAGTSAVPTWITLPLYILYLLPLHRDWRSDLRRPMLLITAFLIGAGIFLALQGGYNWLRFGSPFETGYQQNNISTISLSVLPLGLFGQFISTPRGLIWHVPFVLLIPPALWLGWRTHNQRRLLLVMSQSVLIFLIYSGYTAWWAGLSWGPRYLVTIMPALTLLIIPLFDHILSRPSWLPRLAALIICLISFLTQAAASLLDYLPAEITITDALWQITPPPTRFPDASVLTDPAHLPLIRQFAALREGQWDVFWLSDLANRPYDSQTLDPVIAHLNTTAAPNDALLTILPITGFAWLDAFSGTQPELGLTMENPLSERTASRLESVTQAHPRLWLISEGTVAGNPDNGVEHWLSEHGYSGSETWLDGIRIISYTFDTTPPESITADTSFNSQITLESASITITSTWLNVQLNWQATDPIPQNYTVFLHLLDSAGNLIAQHDGTPAAAYQPTSAWQPNQIIEDRRHLVLPANLRSGEYHLMLGLYDPTTGLRLLLDDGSGDSYLLYTLTIGE